MPLLGLQNVSLTFVGPPLLDSVSFQIDAGERLGLLGRNGAGKSTLLRVLEGTLAPDSGEVFRQPGARVASLPQEMPGDLPGSIRDYLHDACGVSRSDHGWAIETRIDQATHDLDLDPEAAFASLSAGSKRRVLLAAALVADPDVLILDEPTNHLDLDAIRHVEDTLQKRPGALIFVTHDRRFLRNLATRILDLDRGTIRSYRSGYDAYLEKREQEQSVERDQSLLFDRKLAQEEAWVRRGIKARRTRNEGRVRALEALRLERRARRDPTARVQAQLLDVERSGRMVLRCQGLGYAAGGRPIVRDFTSTILRGDRVGILGPNGCGKTTLIRLLLGELEPDAGTVKHGTRLEVAHLAQVNDPLDDARTLAEIIGAGRETIPIGGGERHVVGYLRDFLFTPEQIQAPVRRLSGGERKRLELARVLSRPCNLLVLDEPTNDLDLETLELLEDLLLEFQGTLLLVSHDRAFLDNVVTSTIVFEGKGRWGEYVGGYEDWLRQRKAIEPAPAPRIARSRTGSQRDRPPRMGFKEKRELEALPARIEALEAERQRLFTLMSSASFYASRGDEVAETRRRLATVEVEIESAYARWTELEARADGGTT